MYCETKARRLFICLFLPALAVTQLVSAEADILISFPKGVDAAWVQEFTDAVEHSTNMPVVGIVAPTAEPSPPVTPPQTASDLLATAHAKYKELHLEEVLTTLTGAEAVCLDNAGFEICRSFLFEINLLRGLTLEALNRSEEAAQAFRSAHLADRSRVVDPRQYPPRILRAFAKACSVPDRTAELTLTSDPAGADFYVNGEIAKSPTRVGPGRHIVEGRFVGYQRAWKSVDIGIDRKRIAAVDLRLTPKSEMEAWKTLVQQISSASWRPGEQGMAALLNRFKISHVVLLESPHDDGARYEASLGEPGEADLIVLPSPGRPLEPASEAFHEGLKRVLGIPTPAVVAPRPPEEADIPDDDEANELDEQEDPSLRFTDPEEVPETPNDSNRRLIRSPWLWISVGVVAAIVTGFAVTQIGD